jgi:hypothetical protein
MLRGLPPQLSSADRADPAELLRADYQRNNNRLSDPTRHDSFSPLSGSTEFCGFV